MFLTSSTIYATAPIIANQQPLSMASGGTLLLTLDDVTITDPDSSQFSLLIDSGSFNLREGAQVLPFPQLQSDAVQCVGFTYSGLTIQAEDGFEGLLIVPIRAFDGEFESEIFELEIEVESPICQSCKALLAEDPSTPSGIYIIDPDLDGPIEPFEAYCDMETDGGGWTVFQRRQDGSVDFYLYWADYRDGFGNLDGEFWLGNEHIHELTKNQDTELRVDLRHGSGEKRYAQYATFYINDELDYYRLTVRGFTGTAGDSLTYHNANQFSTRDIDRDQRSHSCAPLYQGAWWYRTCHVSNLNGLYLNGSHSSYADGVNWHSWTGYYYSLPFAEMKLR